jgi:hypothetical protein
MLIVVILAKRVPKVAVAILRRRREVGERSER